MESRLMFYYQTSSQQILPKLLLGNKNFASGWGYKEKNENLKTTF